MATFKAFKGRKGTAQIKMVGLDKAMKRLRRLEKKSDDLILREMLRAATRIVKRANRDVPVLTGRLLRSMRVDKQGRRNVIINIKEKYAGFVEFGTSRMSAQPYFFKHIPFAIKIMEKNLKRLIEKA